MKRTATKKRSCCLLQRCLINITANDFSSLASRFCYISSMDVISWNDFEKIDMRVGTIVEAKEFAKAKKPAYQLIVDFGELGLKTSSAQITHFYSPDSLVGQQVIAVVNFPGKKIADFVSECLVMGIYDEHKNVVLLQPQQQVSNGLKIG